MDLEAEHAVFIAPLFFHLLAPPCAPHIHTQIFARAGLIVDLEAVHALLLRKLPGVLAGQSVDELREPWPVAV